MFGSFLVFVRVLRLMMSHGFPNIANASHTAYSYDLSGMISGIVRYVVLQKHFSFFPFFFAHQHFTSGDHFRNCESRIFEEPENGFAWNPG